MDYHLYYHDDFDGMASGAVMLNFLRSRGDDIVSYNPIDYTPKLNEAWVKYKFKKPFILVDFRYHPAAEWWFDHHESSFTKPALPEWEKSYKNDRTHFRSPKFASCASLIWAHLFRIFGYKPSEHIRELVKWDDIIDGFKYKSPVDAVESRNPALKLRLYTFCEKNKKYRINLIKKLSVRPINNIISKAAIASKIKSGEKANKKIIKKIKKTSLVLGKSVFVDGVKNSFEAHHFMVYYVFPKSKYSVVLEKMVGGYHLGIGLNPWHEEKKHVDISKITEKYGGGGHRTVGAVEKRSKKEIMKIAQEVIEYLNKHG